MARQSFPLPGLFGGISEQIPAMRHPTQCESQINAVSTLRDGLRKRPGTSLVSSLLTTLGSQSIAGGGGAAFAHVIDRGAPGSRWFLVATSGNLMVYDLESGAAQTVEFPHGTTYLQCPDPARDLRATSVADYTFLVNRQVVTSLTTDSVPANPVGVAYVHVRTAVVKTSFKIFVNGIECSCLTGESTSNGEIASRLAAAVNSTAVGSTAFVIPGTNIVKILRAEAFTCSASDSWSNDCLRVLSNGVPLYADLPPTFETGYTLEVRADPERSADAYYVKWDGKGWVETAKPGVLTTLDPATLPMQLYRQPSGVWRLERVLTWGTRKTGDDNTNPVPSFVGSTLNNVFFWRNRLGFLSEDRVVLSSASRFFDFWGKSATQVLASDPIDLTATAERVDSLEWAVPFNTDLLLWGRGAQQYVLQGAELLTPETARVQPTSNLEVNPAVRPKVYGSRVFLASTVGGRTRINLYRVGRDTVSHEATDITEHVPTRIPAAVADIALSGTYKALAVIPQDSSGTIHLLKYADTPDGDLAQKAWQVLQLGHALSQRVILAHWLGSRLTLVLAQQQGATWGYHLETLDLDPAPTGDYGGTLSLSLDRKAQVSYNAAGGYVDLPYWTATAPKVYEIPSGAAPEEISVTALANPSSVSTRLWVSRAPVGSVAITGYPVTMTYTFTPPVLRDQQGNPLMSARTRVVALLVRHENTGDFSAVVSMLQRPPYIYQMSGRVNGYPGQGVGLLGVSSGEFRIPVQASPEGLSVSISSTSPFPLCIPYAEWLGDVTKEATR